MKKYFFVGGLLFAFIANAQLVNNGATIVVQTGGAIFCAGSFTNTSGTVTNDGKIEVQGNFANSGTYNSTTADDSLILSGSGNATLSGGGATFRFLTINKVANTDLVTLTSTVNVGNKLDFLIGGFSTDYLANPNYSVTAPSLAVFNFAAGREIAGNVKRTGWINGSTVLFNGANMQVTTAGGTAPTDLMVTMLPQAFGGDPSQAEREVKRKFLFTPTGGSGYTTDVRFPYLTSELNVALNANTEANLVPWNLLSSEWNARLTPVSRDAANGWVITTGIDAASLAQEWKLADPRYIFRDTAILRGAWNGADMNTVINGILPTNQPYSASPFNYAGTESAASIPNANIVDWVLVELRKPSAGVATDAISSTIIGRKAGFLLRNGSIADLDGATPISFNITKQGSGNFITVRHRNHLGVMSNAIASNEAGTFINNFTALGNTYTNSGIPTPPMTLLGGTKYGLWAGNASNADGVVNSSDIGLVKSQANAALTGYQVTDVTMDATVNSSDIGLAKQSANAAATTHSARMQNKPAQSHLPAN